MLLLLMLLFAPQPARDADVKHPLAGLWVLDLDASRANPKGPMASLTLEFTVRPGSVEVTDHVTDMAGRSGGATNIFVTDGVPYKNPRFSPCLMVARWNSPRILEIGLIRDNGVGEQQFYEVSADGRTLTIKSEGSRGPQELVFHRK